MAINGLKLKKIANSKKTLYLRPERETFIVHNNHLQ